MHANKMLTKYRWTSFPPQIELLVANPVVYIDPHKSYLNTSSMVFPSDQKRETRVRERMREMRDGEVVSGSELLVGRREEEELLGGRRRGKM